MSLTQVNPIEIQRSMVQGKGGVQAKNMAFGDFLAGVSAMTPFATEFTRQATGNVNAATVLNAAFASFPAAASAFAGGAAPSWAAQPYGMPPIAPYGSGAGYAGGGIPGLGANDPAQNGLVSGGQVVPGTQMTQFQLMEVMNQNNLKLIELQAIMQSNMQTWNTKSNILSADHRAKMSMIEKFTARG